MKSTIVRLVFTVFLLWLTIQVNLSFESYIAYIFIFTVGILHGSNDVSLINYISQQLHLSSWKFLLLYIFIIVFMSFLFYLFPFVALVIFIAFSCYHFGEQHLYNLFRENSILNSLLFFFYGAFIFGMLFYVNIEDTISIIFELTGVELGKTYFLSFLIVSSTITLLLFYLRKDSFKDDVSFLQELFLLLLFFIIFKMASLLWGFAIYFIVWHSIPSLEDQMKTLYGDFTKQNLIKYVKSSFLNWLISLAGLVAMYYASSYIELRFITLFFAFLAAITIPHVIVMYFLNQKS